MKIKRGVAFLFIILFILGCKHDEFDAVYYAKSYCKCLTEERRNGKDFFEARTKCDGQLLVSNHFFRIDYIDYTYGRYLIFLPQSLDDSVADFHSRFYGFVEKNCCSFAAMGCDKNDSFQIKRNRVDTLGLYR